MMLKYRDNLTQVFRANKSHYNADVMNGYVKNDLIFDKDRNIWQLASQDRIPYSDGRVNEIYLKKVIQNADDLSSTSDELENCIIDYPSQYHLSSKRSLLLKGFEFDPLSSVLEVGCGCGAITRFLGEIFNTVIAVEGSPHRAEIASLRTRDIDSVHVISAPLQQLVFSRKFDLIFCIGVLEYASVFIKDNNPVYKMLTLLHKLLSNDGTLVMAIENQFGLQYFAGRPEDHTGIRFEGIEGYPTFGGKHAITFGRKELSSILMNNNFDAVNYYYPFPDYKFPQCILSQEFLRNETGINPGEIINNVSSSDNYQNCSHLFNQRLVWHELEKNALIEDFSNSFLIFAHKSRSSCHISSPWLAKLYNVGRSKSYRTLTTVCNEENKYTVYKKRLHPSNTLSDKLQHSEDACAWEAGQSLSQQYEKQMNTKDFDIQRFVSILMPWIYFLAESNEISETATVAGDAIDKMPWNIIVRNDTYYLIDQEWTWNARLTLKFCVARGIYHLLLRINENSVVSGHLKGKTVGSVMKKVCSSIFPHYSDSDFSDFLKTETEFQSIVYEKPFDDILSQIRSSMSFGIGATRKGHRLILFIRRLRAAAIKYTFWMSEYVSGK